MIRRLLVPVDFSPRSHAALGWATALAAEHGAEVDVLHVVRDGGLDLALARDDMDAFLSAAELHHVVPHVRVERGEPAAVIAEVARATPDDLIVMATRGHRGVVELVLGSVAHAVIDRARIPVVTLTERR